jgi:hypothetical protein
MKDLIIIALLGVLSFVWDITKNKDKFTSCIHQFKACSLHLFHHLIFVFVAVAWLSNQRSILIAEMIAIAVVLIGWFIYDWKCVVTVQVDEMCNTKDSFKFLGGELENQLFNVQTSVGKRKSRITQVVLMIIFFAVCWFKLSKKKG